MKRLLISYLLIISISITATLPAQAQAQAKAPIDVLYEQAVALYEQIEKENAHILEVNGISMGYLDFGPKDGVPLIWSHGTGWTGYEILNVKDGLIEAGYRVIAIDYRGHGKTQSIDVNTSLYDVADDIAVLMDYLDISKAVIGGWSKGGYVSTAFYDVYPRRTLGLLLEDGGSASCQRRHDENPIKKSVFELMKKSIEDVTNTRYSSRIEMFRAQASAFGENISIDDAINLLSKWRQETDGTWRNHFNIKLIYGDLSGFVLKKPSSHPLMEWSQQSMIPEIIFRNLDVPMHIFDPVSENDMARVTGQNVELKNQHPDLIEHEVYESTGHAVHLTRPERFVKSAKMFLGRIIIH